MSVSCSLQVTCLLLPSSSWFELTCKSNSSFIFLSPLWTSALSRSLHVHLPQQWYVCLLLWFIYPLYYLYVLRLFLIAVVYVSVHVRIFSPAWMTISTTTHLCIVLLSFMSILLFASTCMTYCVTVTECMYGTRCWKWLHHADGNNGVRMSV